MSCAKNIARPESAPPCKYPLQGEEKLCGAWADCARVVDGVMLAVCGRHAGDVDTQRNPGHHPTAPFRPTPEEHEEEQRMHRAAWNAEQMKLPLHKRRTLDQAVAEEEADMGGKLRRASRKGRL